MTQFASLALILCAALCSAEERAKNVILFLGDAGGIPVLNAAAAYKGKPQSLFIQSMPYIGLSDTSTASVWVTDSAAGMTAIVTGHKTQSGVISQAANAIRGKQDGDILPTILEYAEERGLSTGVITNDKVTGATAAACYSHANDRSKSGEIFAQLLQPRAGDGVDILIGPGGKVLEEAAAVTAADIEPALKAKGYRVAKSLDEFEPDARRTIVLLNSGDYDVETAVDRAIKILSRNSKGYFLMVEVDVHTDKLKLGLDRLLLLDRVIEKTVRTVGKDTLVIFTADHSFDTRVRNGRIGQPVLPAEGVVQKRPVIRVDDGHAGEEVLVAAQGPGANRVKGFFPNTRVFEIMMAAYGWNAQPLRSDQKPRTN